MERAPTNEVLSNNPQEMTEKQLQEITKNVPNSTQEAVDEATRGMTPEQIEKARTAGVKRGEEKDEG